MNIIELKVEILRKFGTQEALAEKMDWHKNKMSKLMTGKYLPDIEEVAVLSETLQLSEERFKEIFLTRISPNGEKNAG